MKKVDIHLHHLTRIEGHGNLIIKASDGRIEEARWEVPEPPRFFEMMFRKRPWYEVHVLASRICGICSVSHQMASLSATEAAFGCVPSEQTVLLRKLLYCGEMIESHMLHVYCLAAPDLLSVGSVFPLFNTKDGREKVLKGLNLKKLGNTIMEVIGGRSIHPQSTAVNGFNTFPTEKDLLLLQGRLKDAADDLEATVELFKGLEFPEFSRETEYIALKHPEEYALIRGDISSTDTGLTPVEEYLSITNEYCVPHSTAKFTKHARGSYAVGALARINNNYDQLHPLASKAADELSLKPLCCDPFMNNVAQVVETIHEVEEASLIINTLLEKGIEEEVPEIEVKAGRGVGAVEAPRGLLIHELVYGEDGRILKANCIIPTGQNHGNIQRDLEKFAPLHLQRGDEELKLLCSMLVRSYDPCISCSTH